MNRMDLVDLIGKMQNKYIMAQVLKLILRHMPTVQTKIMVSYNCLQNVLSDRTNNGKYHSITPKAEMDKSN